MDPVVSFTLGGVLTAAGVPIAAALVERIVEYLKATVLPRVNGMVLAFILTAALYAIAFAFAGQHTPDGAFVAVLAWLGCGLATVGIHKTAPYASPSP